MSVVTFNPAVGATAAELIGAAIISGTVGGAASAGTAALLHGRGFRAGIRMMIKGAIRGGFSAGIANKIGGSETFDIRNSLEHGVTQGAIEEVSGGDFRQGFVSAFVGASTPRSRDIALDTALTSLSGGIAARVNGGKFADGAVTIGFFRLFGHMADHATQQTDRLKSMACTSNANNKCVYDERGVLRTDGTRGSDKRLNPSGSSGLLSKIGMDPEASGSHIYDPGGQFENKYLRYYVTDVSKIHDWFNSVNYNRNNGLFISRGPIFDSTFQIYSFSGMPVAGVATLFGYAGNSPLMVQLLYYNRAKNYR